MNIEPLKSLCNYTRYYGHESYGYFDNFTVFRYDNRLNNITIYYPEDNKSTWNWACKVFNSPQDALNELIQSIAKIKHFQLQAKLNTIEKDF